MIHYHQIHEILKSNFPKGTQAVFIPELKVHIKPYTFESKDASRYLSGSEKLDCKTHGTTFENDDKGTVITDSTLNTSDFDIQCNKSFKFYVLSTEDNVPENGWLLFFHGLNEKSWDKYLPWAYDIARKTKKAIVLFPIAFHMDRAPEAWSAKHEMLAVAKERAKAYPENAQTSSFINAAISSRLAYYPQRLFWSGLQTYADLVQLIESVNKGEISEILPQAHFDIFGYSIGSFLSLILKMANPKEYFTHAKLFCFCGGMTIDRMFPISKYIMDAQAAIRMQQVFAELLSAHFEIDERLKHFQDEKLHPHEAWFKTMLRYNYFVKDRESKFASMSHQVKALVLLQDEVAPPIEALNTLKGGFRDIPVEVSIDDYSYPYTHMNPFSLVHKYEDAVDQAFDRFTESVSNFINS